MFTNLLPRYRSGMSYKHVGTAGDLVRFGCSLKVEGTHSGAQIALATKRFIMVLICIVDF